MLKDRDASDFVKLFEGLAGLSVNQSPCL
jgi:hypothetical protein